MQKPMSSLSDQPDPASEILRRRDGQPALPPDQPDPERTRGEQAKDSGSAAEATKY